MLLVTLAKQFQKWSQQNDRKLLQKKSKNVKQPK
jgi:hypothetical protein